MPTPMDAGSSDSPRTEETGPTEEKQATHLCKHCDVIRQLDDLDSSDSCLAANTFPSDHGCGFIKDVTRLYHRLTYFREVSLQELSDSGCAFCRLLLAGVEETFPRRESGESGPDLGRGVVISNLRFEWDYKLEYPRKYELRALGVSVRLEDDRDMFFHISSPQESACARFLKIPVDPPLGHPLSERAVAGMKSWLSDCAQTCHPPADSYVLPTRLIDVGEPERKEPHLVATSTIPEQPRTPKYAALSYCRGPPPYRRLTTEKMSLEDNLQRIRLERFPKTVRDAILVARALDIQYLWVDTLCIIQDDAEDWDVESSRMHEVYGNAYVTLIPYMSQFPNDGFLGNRSSTPRPSIEIPFESSVSPSITGSYFLHSARPQREYYWHAEDLKGSPWRSRGWTMQEEQLSSRKLMFGVDRTTFDCSNGVKSDRDHVEKRTSLDELGLDGELSSSCIHKIWDEKVIPTYSGRDLTKYWDKLPAVSGIAKVFQQRLDDQYVAGLWRSRLHCDLLWQQGPHNKDHVPRSLPELLFRLTRMTPYVAPSWSWASRTGKLSGGSTWEFISEYPHRCEIIDVQIRLGGTDAFGRIKAAHLTLEGKYMTMQDFFSKEFGRIGYSESGDWKLSSDKQTIACFLDWLEISPLTVHMHPGFLDRVILFITAGHALRAHAKYNDFLGLMLYRLDEVDEWVRIGVFIMSSLPRSPEESNDVPSDTWKTRSVKIV